MRILSSLLGVALVFLLTLSAAAKCHPDALGTSRTIELDPSKHRSIQGKEKSLGLKAKEVVLTFDDGPYGSRTTRILDTLKEECVKATFFYVGTMARANPKLVRRVIKQGHTLGHHTHSHNRLPEYSSAKVSSLIDRGIKGLQKIAYNDSSSEARTPFFRYPYLARTKRTDRIVAKKGLIAIGANIDSLDWKKSTPQQLHDRIMRKVRREGRGIILMHDIQLRTAKMLPSLLRTLKKEGYKVVHLTGKPASKPKPQEMLVASLRTDTEGRGIQIEATERNLGAATAAAAASSASVGVKTKSKTKPVQVVARERKSVQPTKPVTAKAELSPIESLRRKRVRKILKMANVRRKKVVFSGKVKLRRTQWILR